MIVKNEAHVIARCLASVRPLLSSWVVVDTGSTDGTQALVREALRDVPGELHERPWVNFAHNRSEALDLARARGDADYLLVLDADEELVAEPGFRWPALGLDVYLLQTRYGGTAYQRRQLLRAALPWRYEGVVHEYATCEEARTEGELAGLWTRVHHDGARAHDPETYRKDAALLEAALALDPDNARNVFYLAQSHRDAGDTVKALETYARRAAMGGWAEEVWTSLYQIARLLDAGEFEWTTAQQAYLDAYAADPRRAEPLFHLGMYYQRSELWALSHLFLSRAAALPLPPASALFVERDVYTVHARLEKAVAEFYLGLHREALATYAQLVREGQLTPDQREVVERNRRLSVDAMKRS